MRIFRRLAAAAVVTGVLLGGAAGVASASTASTRPACSKGTVRLTGGNTSLTTAPGIAAALLSHGIVPLATLPATEGASASGGVSVTFTFPVTGGSVNLHKVTGTVNHSGGILFIAPATGKEITVSNFVINLKQRDLTAIVNGNAKQRIPLLSLSLAHAKITADKHDTRISAITARLTSTAASALDTTFGTTLFTTGLQLGTASTLVKS